MKHRGPIITLIVVLGALVLMLSLNDALIPNQAAPGAAPTASAQPSGAQAPAEAIYAGRDETGKLAVAIAVKDGRAVGYLCDGKAVEAWLTGTATGRDLTLKEPGGEAEVHADLDEHGVAGIASVGADEFDFDLEPAEPPAGLYRKQDGTTTIGWIVLPDGSQVGIANTDGSREPAPTLDPETDEAELVTGENR